MVEAKARLWLFLRARFAGLPPRRNILRAESLCLDPMRAYGDGQACSEGGSQAYHLLSAWESWPPRLRLPTFADILSVQSTGLPAVSYQPRWTPSGQMPPWKGTPA